MLFYYFNKKKINIPQYFLCSFVKMSSLNKKKLNNSMNLDIFEYTFLNAFASLKKKTYIYFLYLYIQSKIKKFFLRKKNKNVFFIKNNTFINLYLESKNLITLNVNIKYYSFYKLSHYLGNSFVNNIVIKRYVYVKLYNVLNSLLWFLFTFFNMKNLVYYTLKILFLDLIFRNNFAYDKLSLFFYEVKDINMLTSSLVSNYIIRNLRIGHTLNRIIYPLMRHLAESHYILYNGWKIGCFGRFQRRGRARKVWYGKIGVPLNTLIARIDYSKSVVRLRNGLCCIKVFITRTNIYIYSF